MNDQAYPEWPTGVYAEPSTRNLWFRFETQYPGSEQPSWLISLMADGRAQSQVHQGVTTEVIGQCGFSSAPARRVEDAKIMSPGFTEGMVKIDWTSFGDYLHHLDMMPLGVNVAAFVGHGTVHRVVLGDALRPADDDELDQMKDLVSESIDQGAYGFSTGLEYWPGSLATPDQLTELVSVAAKHDVLYATHVRNRDVHYDSGFGEAISCARAAGARLQISHIQPKHGAPEWAMEHAIEMVNSANSHGCDIAYDVIPHDWSHTRVMAINHAAMGTGRWCHRRSGTAERSGNTRQDQGKPPPHVAACAG